MTDQGPQGERRNGGSRPVPDPTVLTTEMVVRVVKAEREYADGLAEVLRERIAAIDRATELRLVGILEIPHQIDEKVAHLAETTAVQFESVSKQFLERDTRSERESRDNKVAVDAAFAAQKEAAAKQDEANQKAIDKSEKATSETLNKQADLFKSTTDAISAQINDIKDRLGRIESVKVGNTENRSSMYAFASFLVTLIVIGGAIAALVAGK